MTGVRGTALVTERRVERAGATTSGDRNGDGLSATTGGADLTPTAAWSRRVRWVGGLIQAAFAAFWLVRGSVVLGGGVAAVLIAVFGVIVIGVFVYAIRATAGTAPRPRSQEGKRIERAVTIATVIEFAAAIVLPVIVSGAGHSDWVLPSVAITIGPLLLWLDYRVHIPRYRPVGWALTVGPVILVVVLSGTALVATTGLGAGVLLLATAAAGFHDLAGIRRAANAAKAGDLVVPASAGAGA
jgi:hypothetical protein